MSLAATVQEERLYRSIPNYNIYTGTGVQPEAPEVCRPEILSRLALKREFLEATSLNSKFDNLVVLCSIGNFVSAENLLGKCAIGGKVSNELIQRAFGHYLAGRPRAEIPTMVHVPHEALAQETVAPRAVSRTEMLATIQNTFALNVTLLAEILNVTRVTIYQWRKEDAPPLKEDSRARLQQIYSLAIFWRSLEAVPGAQLHEYIAGMNTTLETALKQPGVDRDQLARIHAALLRSESAQERRQRAVQTQRLALAKLKANLVGKPVPGVIAD